MIRKRYYKVTVMSGNVLPVWFPVPGLISKAVYVSAPYYGFTRGPIYEIHARTSAPPTAASSGRKNGQSS